MAAVMTMAAKVGTAVHRETRLNREKVEEGLMGQTPLCVSHVTTKSTVSYFNLIK